MPLGKAVHKAVELYSTGLDYRTHKIMAGAQIPILSWISGYEAERRELEENDRYWNDLAKNTGIDTGNFKYPIRQGLYGNAGSYGASIGTFVNEGILNLYKSTRPKTYTIKNYHYHRR